MLQWLINSKILQLGDHLQRSNKQLDLDKFQFLTSFTIHSPFGLRRSWMRLKRNNYTSSIASFLPWPLLLQVHAVNLPAEHLPRMCLTTDLASQVGNRSSQCTQYFPISGVEPPSMNATKGGACVVLQYNNHSPNESELSLTCAPVEG